jgi:hypothetical protein
MPLVGGESSDLVAAGPGQVVYDAAFTPPSPHGRAPRRRRWRVDFGA